MSNSIWKTPEENPDANKGSACYKNLSLVENNRYLQNGAVKPDREWGYVKEIIAQADKAERLQKAVDLIANMEQRLCIDDPVDILDDVLKIAKDEIKQLIKGGQYK